MLKAAIEKIQSLCKPEIREIQGVFYTIQDDGVYLQIKPDLEIPDTITLNSLDALVQMVKTEAVNQLDLLYITIPDHKSIRCFSRPSKCARNQRLFPFSVMATDVPGWEPKVQLPFEEAMIALRTRFQPTADTDYALKLLSDITTGSKITYNDNGVATSVVTKKGVDLQANAAIRPIISLRPYRTFQEVDQPASQFLIRINERGISFIEADGGMWKLAARQAVKDYLSQKLAAELTEGRVVIAL